MLTVSILWLRQQRFYDEEDIEKLTTASKKFGKLREIRKTSKFGACKTYDKWKTIDNPCLGKYDGQRFEPKKLRHYQVHYIIEHGYLPINKVLSHRCHRKLCVEMGHIICETRQYNSKRNGCKTIFVQCGKRYLNKCVCLIHEPPCFYWNHEKNIRYILRRFLYLSNSIHKVNFHD